MIQSRSCSECKTTVDLSARFCPQCGNLLFIDLTQKDLTGEMFLEVLNSLYNLIITVGAPNRDVYLHPVSRKLMNNRFELEHNSELKALGRGIFTSSANSISARQEAINTRITSRSTNAMTGYAVRASEELITKLRSLPLSLDEIQKRINSFKKTYHDEYIVKDIALHMPDGEAQVNRILFVFYLQDDNKHMNYFLDEPLLQRWFCTIIESNTEMVLQKYRESFSNIGTNVIPKTDDIAEEVLNDMVFGYCVRLCESLFPVEKANAIA